MTLTEALRAADVTVDDWIDPIIDDIVDAFFRGLFQGEVNVVSDSFMGEDMRRELIYISESWGDMEMKVAPTDETSYSKGED